MNRTKASNIKREQKKSFFLREFSNIVHALSIEEPKVCSVFVTRVDLSADTGIAYFYFDALGATDEEKETTFKQALEVLKLYRPSLRSALAKVLKSRYVPDLMFVFDQKQDKVHKINNLLDQVQQELHTIDKEQDSTVIS